MLAVSLTRSAASQLHGTYSSASSASSSSASSSSASSSPPSPPSPSPRSCGLSLIIPLSPLQVYKEIEAPRDSPPRPPSLGSECGTRDCHISPTAHLIAPYPLRHASRRFPALQLHLLRLHHRVASVALVSVVLPPYSDLRSRPSIHAQVAIPLKEG